MFSLSFSRFQLHSFKKQFKTQLTTVPSTLLRSSFLTPELFSFISTIQIKQPFVKFLRLTAIQIPVVWGSVCCLCFLCLLCNVRYFSFCSLPLFHFFWLLNLKLTLILRIIALFFKLSPWETPNTYQICKKSSYCTFTRNLYNAY